ncbi:MAG: hypothetical protein ACP5KN_13640 [Armatimonadota bacterium]
MSVGIQVMRAESVVAEALLDREPLWLGPGGIDHAEDGLLLALPARGSRVWAILAPSAGAGARFRGHPVLGGLVDLAAAPLVIDGTTFLARLLSHGPRRAAALESCRCPVCHQPIAAGDEAMVCGCGLVCDSDFCASGGARERRCFACGREFEDGGEPA